jgi:hypothetical protein
MQRLAGLLRLVRAQAVTAEVVADVVVVVVVLVEIGPSVVLIAIVL